MKNALLTPLWGAWTLFLCCIFVGCLVLEGLSFWPVGIVPLCCFLVWLADAVRQTVKYRGCDAHKAVTDSTEAGGCDKKTDITAHQYWKEGV